MVLATQLPSALVSSSLDGESGLFSASFPSSPDKQTETDSYYCTNYNSKADEAGRIIKAEPVNN